MRDCLYLRFAARRERLDRRQLRGSARAAVPVDSTLKFGAMAASNPIKGRFGKPETLGESAMNAYDGETRNVHQSYYI